MWTCGNYHWYMKQCLEFGSKDDEKVSAFCWDREFAYRLHVVLGSGEYLQYNWTWTVCCSSGGTIGDLASVAVIDGSKSSVKLIVGILCFSLCSFVLFIFPILIYYKLYFFMTAIFCFRYYHGYHVLFLFSSMSCFFLLSP